MEIRWFPQNFFFPFQISIFQAEKIPVNNNITILARIETVTAKLHLDFIINENDIFSKAEELQRLSGI